MDGMKLTFIIEDITPKEADDLAWAIILYLRETEDVQVTDYEIEGETG